MKIERNNKPDIVIGKRVTVGAAIGGVANAVAVFYPEHAPAILALIVPLTFAVQLVLANRYGVTQ